MNCNLQKKRQLDATTSYKESAELNRFAKHELEPQKRVHFFATHSGMNVYIRSEAFSTDTIVRFWCHLIDGIMKLVLIFCPHEFHEKWNVCNAEIIHRAGDM